MKEILYRTLAFLVALFFIPVNYGKAPENAKTDFETCENIIVLIGDGMGFNTIAMAEQILGEEFTVFDEFTLQGASRTRTLGKITSDSAAGGTALATGIKTSRKCVGVYVDDLNMTQSYPMNLTELAIEKGMATGIVTTNAMCDATPADFTAHEGYRDNTDAIMQQQLEGEIDLFVASQREESTDYIKNNEIPENVNIVWSMENLINYSYSETKKTVGMIRYDPWKIENINETDEYDIPNPDGSPEKNFGNLVDMTAFALDYLDNSGKNFFLMIENDHIDGNAEDMDAEGMTEAMVTFTESVKLVLDYAKEHGNTLVLVTADHETGCITKFGDTYKIMTSLHTGVDVPLFVYGCDNFIEQGETIENTEIARRIANVMGETNFPRSIEVQK